jgi:Na+/phosphate symporter
MGELGRKKRRAKLALLWLVTLLIAACAVFELDGDDGATAPASEPEESSAVPGDKLRITGVSDAEVNPGDAIVVTVQGLSPDDAKELRAVVAKRDTDILSQRGDRLVVRIPRDIEVGKASIRIVQGERRSKPHDLLVRPLRMRKVVRNLLGGVALLALGLRTLSLGLRGLAGRQLRALLASWTKGSARAAGVGALLGGITQISTSAVGVLLGCLESRLLSLGAAIAVLLGAQLGAVVVGAIIPFSLTREGLFLVAVGAVWTTVSVDRKSESVGKAVLGAGFLLYGLNLLQVGFEPLLASPALFPYVGRLQASLFLCAASGVLLSMLLQGPLPLFGLVVGVVQSSGVLGIESAFAVLAGAGLGTSLVTLLIAWSSTRDGRKLAATHMVFGGATTVLMLASVPVWVLLANRLMPGNPEDVAYGQRILLPRMAGHLGAAFVMAQAAITTLLLPVLVPLTGWIESRRFWLRASTARAYRVSASGSTADLTAHIRGVLATALRADRDGLEAVRELCFRGDRDRGVDGQHAFRHARGDIERLFAMLGSNGHVELELDMLRRTAITTLQFQLTLEDLLRAAERGVEEDLILTNQDKTAVSELHQLVAEGLDTLIAALEQGTAPELEEARAREIKLNACEAEARQSVLLPSDTEKSAAFRLRLRIADLLHAYENVGNPLYRLCEALADEVDEFQL